MDVWNLDSLTITPDILSLISEIDQFKGAWPLLARLSPDRLHALRKVATIESIGSSTRIEGSKLSDSDVEKLLSNVATYSFLSRDEQEVAGYAHVCEEIFQGFGVMVLSENLIKQLHGWLLKFSHKDERHRGNYKTLANHVEAFDAMGKSLGIIFETSTPFDTPRHMEALVTWTRAHLEDRRLHPLLVIGIFAVVFLAIHPFQDGNGRLSRLLTTLLLLRSGYHYVCYSSLESIIEHSKESYYLALRRTQGSLYARNPDFGPWLLFFLRGLQRQKIHLEEKIKREKNISFHLPEASARILECVQDHGRLGLSDLVSMTGINRHTLKKHLAGLVDRGHLIRLGQGRGTWYAPG